MMKKPVEVSRTSGELYGSDETLMQLLDGGVYLPKIKRVMFNTGVKVLESHWENKTYTETRPDGTQVDKICAHKVADKTRNTLATIVEFADGSKVTVTNSEHDQVILNSEGKPTRDAKERGIVYAIVKRILCGRYVGPNNMTFEGFGRILSNLVDNSYDCQAAKKARDAAKNAAKKAAAENAAKPKVKKVSLAETVGQLASTVAKLSETVDSLQAK